VRIATGLDEQDEPMPLFASMKLQSVTSGGRVCGLLTAGVEMDRGVLTPAWGESMADGEFESHPDSGSVIAGAVVPHWSAIVELAVRAHHKFNDVPFISWEIAVGGSGPVLLEASSHIDSVDHVLPAETAFARLCLRRLDELRRSDLGVHPLTVPVRDQAGWQRVPTQGPGRRPAREWPHA
jgi:hypothetical protein